MLFYLQASTTSLYSVRDLLLIAPELILTICACAILVMEVVLPYERARWTAYFSLAAIALAFVSLIAGWQMNAGVLPLTGFYGMIRIDGFAVAFKLIFLCGAALTVAVSLR
ncbi:MAG: hypothetical protein WKF30_19360, partial [Pyrinomonadaceae bacterium]